MLSQGTFPFVRNGNGICFSFRFRLCHFASPLENNWMLAYQIINHVEFTRFSLRCKHERVQVRLWVLFKETERTLVIFLKPTTLIIVGSSSIMVSVVLGHVFWCPWQFYPFLHSSRHVGRRVLVCFPFV